MSPNKFCLYCEESLDGDPTVGIPSHTPVVCRNAMDRHFAEAVNSLGLGHLEDQAIVASIMRVLTARRNVAPAVADGQVKVCVQHRVGHPSVGVQLRRDAYSQLTVVGTEQEYGRHYPPVIISLALEGAVALDRQRGAGGQDQKVWTLKAQEQVTPQLAVLTLRPVSGKVGVR